MGRQETDPKSRLTEAQREAVEAFRKRHRTGVLALLFTDVVGSTALKQRLGDAAGVELLTRQQSKIREILGDYKDAEVITTAGDSCFIVFLKPSDAVRFSLRLQSALRVLTPDGQKRGLLRIGIHMGEVFIAENGGERGGRDVLGIQVDTASRVVSLASGGQILLTRSVFDNARTILKGEALADLAPLSWLNHGRYAVKGVEEPIEICEVGEGGWASLTPPGDSDKARRFAAPDAEPVLGWRPAVDQIVPGTEWSLEERLGEGGFGEVWRAHHRRTRESRVFKFCFRADHLRSLKRELTIFRILKQSLGERPDIARLYDVQFEKAPYYLELEYTPGGSLVEWSEKHGGIEKVSLARRLEIVAQIADALAAAHSVGVIHKDVKPSNVLIEERRDGSVQARLTDFGIGQLRDDQLLVNLGFTATGFTEASSDSSSPTSLSGTRLYMAPEMVAGRPPTIHSDIYSLGAILYQMIAGDLHKPLATDWERTVDDPMLRDDLHQCVAGDPAERFSGADELARRLRSLRERRIEHERRVASERAMVRRRRVAITSGIVAGVLLLIAIALGYGMTRALREKAKAERESYYAMIGLIDRAIEERRFDKVASQLEACPVPYRGWEWGRLQYVFNLDLMTLEHPEVVISVDWSPDSRYLVTASGQVWGIPDFAARIWDADTGKLVQILKGHTRRLNAVAFSHDGKHVVTAAEDQTVRVWDVKTGKEVRRMSGPDSATGAGAAMLPLRALLLHPDGEYLVGGEGLFETELPVRGRVFVWDFETGALERELTAKSGGIQSLAFDPDGKRLAVGDCQGSVEVFDFESGSSLLKFGAHGRIVASIAFSPDGGRMATGGYDSTTKLWDATTGQLLETFNDSTYRVRSVVFTPDGKYIAATVSDDLVRFYDAETGAVAFTLDAHYRGVMAIKFSPDGHRFATGSWDQSAKIWDLNAARSVRIFDDHQDQVQSLAIGRDGRRIATACLDGLVRIWDVATGEIVRTIDGQRGPSRAVAFSPDDNLIAAGYDNGSVKIWDLRSGQELWENKEWNTPATWLRFSPDGKWLAGSSGEKLEPGRGDARFVIWNVETGKEFRSVETSAPKVAGLAFSPDGETIAAGSDANKVSIWSLHDGREIAVYAGELGIIQGIAFSPNGKRIAAGGRNGTSVIWNVSTRRPLATFTGDDIAYQVAFTPDGRRLATGTWGKNVRIWDSETCREILTMRGHGWAVLDLAFSPDGRYLASAGSADNSARVWFAFPWELSDYPGNQEMALKERTELYKRKRWQDRLAQVQTADPIAAVRRVFCAGSFEAGVPLHVDLHVAWGADSSSLTLAEQVPPEWAVRDLTGVASIENGRILWNVSPWTSAGLSVRYELVPPATTGVEPVVIGPASIDAAGGWRREIAERSLAPKGVLAFQQRNLPHVGYGGCEDAHILVYQSDTNTGGCPQIEEGDWNGGTGDHKKALVRFDLSAVPSTFPLKRAELRLYCFTEMRQNWREGRTVYVAPLLKNWGEGKVPGRDGGSPEAGDVTFNSAFNGIESWDMRGAMGTGDVDDWETSATVGADWPEWVTFDVTRSVRQFLQTPNANHGWKISQDSVRGVGDDTFSYERGVYAFKSGEAPEIHLRPLLILISEDAAEASSAGL